MVLFHLFNSQVAQYYITDSFSTNFAYMQSLHTLEFSTNECFQILLRITEEKENILFIKRLTSLKGASMRNSTWLAQVNQNAIYTMI